MTTLREQVREFHAMIGAKDPETPCIPDVKRIRLRLRLIAEEFFEVLAACNIEPGVDGYGPIESAVMHAIGEVDPMVDLPALADAFADLDYVVEGSRFGVRHRRRSDRRGGAPHEHAEGDRTDR